MTYNHSTHHVSTSTTQADTYRIFLLTCWLEDGDDCHDPESWRFRLEDPRTETRRGCVGSKRLIALLCEQLGTNFDDIENLR